MRGKSTGQSSTRSKAVIIYSAVCGLLLVGSVLIAGAAAPARDDYHTTTWQTEDGLPNNGVLAILQSPNGYLWVGTSRGLARFDGVRFTEFTPKNEPGLVSERIWRLCADQRGGFWIAGDDGSLSYWRKNRFQRFAPGGKPYTRKAFSLCVDRENRLWIVTLEGAVDYVENGELHRLGSPAQGSFGPSSVTTDIAGTVWLASRSSLGFFRGTNWVSVLEDLMAPLEIAPRRGGGLWLVAGQRIYEVQANGARREVAILPWPADDTNVRQLLEDRNGRLWVATSQRGLLLLNKGNNGALETVTTSHQSILSLYEDRESNLWVGTQGGGLNRVRQSAFEVFDHQKGVPNDIVHSLAEDLTGKMWFVPQGGGLTFLSNRICQTLPASNFSRLPLLTVAPASAGGVWLGTIYDGLIRWKDGFASRLPVAIGLAGPRADALLEDRQGRLWIGYHAEGLGCLIGTNLQNYDLTHGLPGLKVRVLVEDALGRILIGTGEGGLARFAEGHFETEALPPGIGAVNAIVPLEDGTLWLGTLAGGLVRVRPGSVTRISTTHGLPDDYIANVIWDGAGNLWCGSSKGLFRVALRDLNAVADGRAARVAACSYGRSDGLADFSFPGAAHPSAWRAHDGRLWFASAKGAVAVDLTRLAPNTEPPPVWIEAIRCRDQMIDHAAIAEMPAGDRDWEFHYTALSLTAPEKMRFRHRLVGYDPDWVESSGLARPGAQYRNLAPGDYRFQVIACNNDGVWNEQGDSFQFSIAPYVWETTWFPVVAATMSITLLAFLARRVMMQRVRRRIALLEQQHAVEQERTRIAQDIHDDLGASLTRISLLADLARKSIDRPEQVTSDLTQMSNTAREAVHAMDAIVWAVNPRNDSIEKFADYISLYAEGFLRTANIRCRLDVPPDVPALPLGTEARHNLFLAVKEALNNVVKHAAATEVRIRLKYDRKELHVLVEDNGRGLPASAVAPGSDGLLNIRRRIENFGGQLDITSAPAHGTRICIRLPLPPPPAN